MSGRGTTAPTAARAPAGGWTAAPPPAGAPTPGGRGARARRRPARRLVGALGAPRAQGATRAPRGRPRPAVPGADLTRARAHHQPGPPPRRARAPVRTGRARTSCASTAARRARAARRAAPRARAMLTPRRWRGGAATRPARAAPAWRRARPAAAQACAAAPRAAGRRPGGGGSRRLRARSRRRRAPAQAQRAPGHVTPQPTAAHTAEDAAPAVQGRAPLAQHRPWRPPACRAHARRCSGSAWRGRTGTAATARIQCCARHAATCAAPEEEL